MTAITSTRRLLDPFLSAGYEFEYPNNKYLYHHRPADRVLHATLGERISDAYSVLHGEFRVFPAVEIKKNVKGLPYFHIEKSDYPINPYEDRDERWDVLDYATLNTQRWGVLDYATLGLFRLSTVISKTSWNILAMYFTRKEENPHPAFNNIVEGVAKLIALPLWFIFGTISLVGNGIVRSLIAAPIALIGALVAHPVAALVRGIKGLVFKQQVDKLLQNTHQKTLSAMLKEAKAGRTSVFAVQDHAGGKVELFTTETAPVKVAEGEAPKTKKVAKFLVSVPATLWNEGKFQGKLEAISRAARASNHTEMSPVRRLSRKRGVSVYI